MYGIFTYIWAFFGVNVGKYSSTMDPMGYIHIINHDGYSYNNHGYSLSITGRDRVFRAPQNSGWCWTRGPDLRRGSGAETRVAKSDGKWSIEIKHGDFTYEIKHDGDFNQLWLFNMGNGWKW